MRRLNNPTEQEIHRAVVGHLQTRGAAGLAYLHPVNGGFRRRTEAAIFAGLGVRPGASDLLIWHAGKSYAPELKRPGGRPDPAQIQFLQDMQRAGAEVALCDDLDSALKTLEAWKLLRGTVT